MKKHFYHRIKKIISIGLLAGLLLFTACGKKEIPLTVSEEQIQIEGLTESFEIIFIADTHLTLCDERDAEVADKAASRSSSFYSKEGVPSEEVFTALMDYVKKEQPDLLILGGDIIDSAMWASIDYVSQHLNELEIPWIYTMGNHDFEYGTEYFTDIAYEEYLPRLDSITETTDGYQIYHHNSFNILATDDDNSQISEEATLALAELKQEGKPIIVVSHVPFEPYTDDHTLHLLTRQVWGETPEGNSKVLLGINSCYPNDDTEDFIDMVTEDDGLVPLVLSGHIHFYHRDMLDEDTLQVVTGAGYEGHLIKLTLQP